MLSVSVFRTLAVVTAFTVMGGTIALTQTAPAPQPEPKAEEAFKNIISLKGRKASDVIPAMHFMSASLGTDCAFCHTEGNFADEAKKTKATAREMIAMTKKLNDDFFGGKNEVTCNSCHNGRTHPAGAAMPFPITARLRDTSLTADTVLSAFATAVHAPTAPSTLTLTGTVEHPGGKSSAVTTKQTSGGMFLESETGGASLGYNGKEAFYKMGEFKQVVPPPDHAALIRYVEGLWAGLPKLEKLTAGKETVSGKAMDVVVGTRNGVTAKFIFDPETHLLARVAYFETSVLGRSADVYEFSDYKAVNGTMVPMTVTHFESAARKVVKKYAKAEFATLGSTAEFEGK
jgi:hypothetical protein